MHKIHHLIRVLIFVSAAATAFPAAAQQMTSGNVLNFGLAPFSLGNADFAGAAAIVPETGTTGLAFSDDFLEKGTAGRKIRLKAQRDNWTLFANYRYPDSGPAAGAVPQHEFPDLRAQITKLGASYRFATWKQTDFEVVAGTRYKPEDVRRTLYMGDHTRRTENDEWWRNTFVGLRFFTRISENLSFIGRGDIAQGHGEDDIGWNAVAMFDYRLGDWGSFYFGYKLLAMDEAADTGMERYSYDALRQGPFVGLSLRW